MRGFGRVDPVASWSHGLGVAVFVGIIAIVALPGALVLPVLAGSMFLLSIASMLASQFMSGEAQDQARLFAAVTVFIGIAAAVLTDSDKLVPFLQ
jgi:hypothetical protein